jgi:hypothetical protein
MDGIDDCPTNNDETMFEINETDIIKQLQQTHYRCEKLKIMIHKRWIQNHNCGDQNRSSFDYRKDLSFQTVCDGFIE